VQGTKLQRHRPRRRESGQRRARVPHWSAREERLNNYDNYCSGHMTPTYMGAPTHRNVFSVAAKPRRYQKYSYGISVMKSNGTCLITKPQSSGEFKHVSIGYKLNQTYCC